jgi:hypothetical protein
MTSHQRQGAFVLKRTFIVIEGNAVGTLKQHKLLLRHTECTKKSLHYSLKVRD